MIITLLVMLKISRKPSPTKTDKKIKKSKHVSELMGYRVKTARSLLELNQEKEIMGVLLFLCISASKKGKTGNYLLTEAEKDAKGKNKQEQTLKRTLPSISIKIIK